MQDMKIDSKQIRYVDYPRKKFSNYSNEKYTY